MYTNKNQSANLFLSHAHISETGVASLAESASSEVGYWTLDKASTTWRVNMRVLCGPMWDKYSVFGLRLNQATYEELVAWPATTDDMFVSYRMRGLKWENCAYDPVTQTNQPWYYFYNAFVGVDGGVATLNPTQSVGYFSKGQGQDRVELTIDSMQALYPSLYISPTGAATTPALTWKFEIFPVE